MKSTVKPGLPRPAAHPEALLRRLREAASEPYRRAGLYAYRFARGKLRADPMFRAILERGLLRETQQVLDLGCGQALLTAWLLAAARCYAGGAWPAGWPEVARAPRVRGIELKAREVKRARRALGQDCDVTQADIRCTAFGSADAIVLVDVLHYLRVDAQRDVLHRVRAALPSGGVLLLRVGDAAAGLRFRITSCVDKFSMLTRGHGLVTTYCHSVAEWRTLLRDFDFESEAAPMSQGTPFANVLLIAHAR